MDIQGIFEEISSISSTNQKIEVLNKYKDFPLLKEVIYLALSRRVKFYIRQIPEVSEHSGKYSLRESLGALQALSSRTLTGNQAKDFLKETLEKSSSQNADILCRIIDKDLKIGIATTNTNKVFPKLIEKTPYMGAIPFSKEAVESLLEEGEIYSQVKMDGRYVNAMIRHGEVDLESRDGEITELPGNCFLVRELKAFPIDCVLNGELTIPGLPRYVSNGIIASIISISKKQKQGIDTTIELAKFECKYGYFKAAANSISLTTWDLITVPQYFEMKADVHYSTRFQYLKDFLRKENFTRIRIVRSKKVTSYEEVMDHFYRNLKSGEEGTIVKSLKGFWKNGKPKYQVKIKIELSVEMEIIDFNYGTGKNSEVISSIITQSSCGKVITTPAGMNEETMEYVTDNQTKLKNTIIEVMCAGLSTDREGNYSLLHPRFIKFRDDKIKANSLKEIQQIENSIKGL